ncbi:hypothetical protein A2291_03290 [candidate division WOR-1 bacterium RIFOXYB2_FULL_42_35]|uniref:Uncharacterized protein n=1 Tax=candidate division WOR-1 bacterium RIFOXYC2_FULL_41_25 TaxID=1802586 RepID=A0A1F4TS31_UNCSA|nr:MAG: hypothetical protein A2247_02565 [candidate division WOR-1 bacterium RIFOXYA2_FULL_41_14]OGC25765.1 MAG: hypothetical protein A2291_03290 [candidate division WOR-1 bacterium RIFOXYB2_FULL_42_35]OGC35399.1 MAG: hypothetical protein A2462_02520 [candidate division WOR-1 bacterium RIFOXYC2_FULL_41_25]
MAARKKRVKKDIKQESINERNRIALAFMVLAKDKTFARMPEEQKMNLVKEVLTIGDEVAGWLQSEYGSNDPRKIASKMGIKVFGEDNGKAKRSEYRDETKEIIVYRDFHNRLLKEVKSPELSEHLLKFVVAHELFRYLEMNRIGEINKRYKFTAWKLGPYGKEKHIKGLSAVAAQAFTQTILGLEISPEVFDYLTYILYSSS